MSCGTLGAVASRLRPAVAGFVLVLSASMATTACAIVSPAPTPVVQPSDRSFCVEQTNRFRMSAGLSPLAHADDLDTFAADAAKYDATAGAPHVYFKQTNGGGVSRAEIELLWWHDFTVRDAIAQGIAQMWQAGPGGEHYDILAGPYSQIGCGIFVEGSVVSVAQDFR